MRRMAWIVATLIVAVVVHVASVWLLPHVLMWRTMGAIASRAGVNTMVHRPRPDAAARQIVRPSPDLLYSTCAFDLKNGPVRVRASGMPGTYWSVSLFDAETNNFYVLNDRQAKTGAFDLLIVDADWEKPMVETLARAPTRRGLVLVRTLIDDDAHLAAIDAARRHATCGAMYAPHP